MKTAMAANAQQLIKDWIQYLKNLQIVSLKSDPTTGKLQYKRQPTSDDISRFLEVKTDFQPDQISNAIHTVLAKKAQSGTPQAPVQPPEPAQPAATEPAAPSPEPEDFDHNDQNPNGVQDNEPAEPAEPEEQEPKRKPHFKYRSRNVNEDFQDSTALQVNEKDVEEIFNLLIKGPATQAGRAAPAAGEAPNPEEAPKPDTDALNKIKRTIRDTMTDSQRKSLWRALNEN